MVRTATQGTIHAVILLALLVATAAIYAPVAHAPFVYEDANWQTTLPDIPHDFAPRPTRALTHLTFQWTYDAVGLAPAAYHLTNVAIHLVNGVLVFALAAVLFEPAVALGAAGLFLLHPLNSEAVSYVTARADLLSTTFALVAVLAALGRRRPALLGAVCLVALALATQAKETGVVAVGLVLMTVVLWRRQSLSLFAPWLSVLWVLVGVGVGAIWEHLQALFVLSPGTSGSTLTLPEYALLQAGMTGSHLTSVAWWSGLTIDHDVLALSRTWLVTSVLGVTVALLVVATTWRRRPSLAWTLAWVAVALAPRFVVRTNEFITEPQMYLALISVWIGVSACSVSIWRAVAPVAEACMALCRDRVLNLKEMATCR